eukprot:scaffold1106_cov608-Prasinococcus_capsulatus_cf.AAC.5
MRDSALCRLSCAAHGQPRRATQLPRHDMARRAPRASSRTSSHASAPPHAAKGRTSPGLHPGLRPGSFPGPAAPPERQYECAFRQKEMLKYLFRGILGKDSRDTFWRLSPGGPVALGPASAPPFCACGEHHHQQQQQHHHHHRACAGAGWAAASGGALAGRGRRRGATRFGCGGRACGRPAGPGAGDAAPRALGGQFEMDEEALAAPI